MYRASQLVNYPWVSRLDRNIYKKYPQLDPIPMTRKCFFLGLTGYVVGRMMGWNRKLSMIGFVAPVLGKFMVDEWKVAKVEPIEKGIGLKNVHKNE